MISYLTTYNAEDSILRVISCPPHLVSLQRLRPGELVLEGKANGDTQKIVNGKIVDKTLGEINAFKKAQGHRLRFESAVRKPIAPTPLQID